MPLLKEIIKLIEQHFPPAAQENYDNSGLITGNPKQEITKTLLTIDIDEKVIDEAINRNANLIIAHHPIIFKALKRLTPNTYIERTIIKAIKNDIAIYAAHTSVDNNINGLNKIIAEKIGLNNTKIIQPKDDFLMKLAVFVPNEYADQVRNAIFEAGAGHIGNYDACSYNIQGTGTFKAGENTNPFVGEKGKLHFEAETKIETIFPVYLQKQVISAMLNAHPYEEVAYDIYPLKNKHPKFGTGIIGTLPMPIEEQDFLQRLKSALDIKCLKYSQLLGKPITKVAICTGACHFLMEQAISAGADIFISAEFKYNHYIEARNRIVIADAGHYETEIFIKNLFYKLLTKNFTNFAVEFAEDFQNPVNCL